MIGDKMLIYNRDTGQFFSRWRVKRAGREPIWCDWAHGAHVFSVIRDALSVKEELGMGVRIVSETEGRKIDALRKYREAK